MFGERLLDIESDEGPIFNIFELDKLLRDPVRGCWVTDEFNWSVLFESNIGNLRDGEIWVELLEFIEIKFDKKDF